VTRWKLRIEERAEAEARAAFLWYLARSGRAAEQFQAAVEESIALIAGDPASSPELEPGLRRRLVLHRFPYAVIYRVLGDEVHILAFAHLRRRPGYWRR
jgi:plasmid stabilization system protein ParE